MLGVRADLPSDILAGVGRAPSLLSGKRPELTTLQVNNARQRGDCGFAPVTHDRAVLYDRAPTHRMAPGWEGAGEWQGADAREAAEAL